MLNSTRHDVHAPTVMNNTAAVFACTYVSLFNILTSQIGSVSHRRRSRAVPCHMTGGISFELAIGLPASRPIYGVGRHGRLKVDVGLVDKRGEFREMRARPHTGGKEVFHAIRACTAEHAIAFQTTELLNNALDSGHIQYIYSYNEHD